MLKNKRHWLYCFFTASIISGILVVEDFLEGEVGLDQYLLLDFFADVILYTIVSFCLSLLTKFFINLLNERLPWETTGFKRIYFEILLLLILVILFTVTTSTAVNTLDVNPETDEDFGFEIIALIMYFIDFFMLFTYHEFDLLNQDKRIIELEAERLLKQNYITKYEALKNQINPHFLFNSLNVLSSLIYLDTTKSDEFIKKFSEVFRYVLELNQERIVPVKKELSFIDDYLFLQKIRFMDNLVIHKNLDADVLDKEIPPMALQLALENAIKHNIISKTQQLHVTIENDDEHLIVKNNFQYKQNAERKTGIGQNNLKERYQLISDKAPSFTIEDSEYIVYLPFLENNKHEWSEQLL